jgi:hypothetical protein
MKNNTTKIVAVTNPGAIVDNTAFSSTAIDCLGFAYLSVFCMFGAMDIAMAGLKLQECDAVGGSYVDITGAAYTGAALPSATSDNLIYGFDVNLLGRKRFIKLVATGGDGAAGSYMAAWGALSSPSIVPNSATLRGLAAVIAV